MRRLTGPATGPVFGSGEGAAAASPRRGAALSIQSRIAAAAVTTAVAVLCAASATFFWVQWDDHVASMKRAQGALAGIVALQAGRDLDAGRPAAGALAMLEPSRSVHSSALLDGDGRVVAAYTRPGASRADHVYIGRAPVRAGGRVVGQVIVAGAMGTASQVLARSLAVSLALFFAATGVAVFLGRALARPVVEPLAALHAVMASVTLPEHYSRRAQPGAADEVGRLTASFNALLARLEANDSALRATLAELIRARDAAEAANRLKSQFLANMSHEIRTPLNGVLAMTQVIAMDELSPVQRGRLNVVHESGQALLAILNDVLDVSKIEAGKLDLECAAMDAAAVVRGACDAFAAVTADKGLRFEVAVAPEAEGVRRGDAVRLRQVVVNLVSNAVKFTAAGQVAVRLSGHGEGGADGLRLEVSDTGCGIASEHLAAVFDKFTQADQSTTRRFGGTGLGLAICRELVAMMGGAIEVDSEEGRGSRFVLDLPLPALSGVEAEPAPEPPVPSAPAMGAPLEAAAPAAVESDEERPLRVLAAEDNPTNRLVLSTVMGVFGADLTLVEDGREAVVAWEAGEFDVVLMDIMMPNLDGVGAAREIRAREAASGRPRTPIVALSANAMTHQVREYLAAGMDAHVPKPIELPRLHAVLGAVLAAPDAPGAGGEAQAA